ncbi:lytic transglycosylase domain-containing protein [Subtercola sp. RTI3]|uniref:lytic transglycosylase domain-containing protein n=1 Tax=Subtercola sp. RTI3 TaxID=3048639 RepID=UPI002B232DB2|nr:lytic murein transglycosylase [Subtercola sp. RTI3]MEA9986800.1 lytic murein transglycosylase [Subtercola sp. RTI3]
MRGSTLSTAASAVILTAAALCWLATTTPAAARQPSTAAPAVAAQPEAAVAPEPASAATAPVTVPRSGIDAGWLARVSASTGIPARALQGYAAAAVSLASTDPGCHAGWNTIAAIGDIESGHGTHGGAQIGADGNLTGSILGPALDGSDNTQALPNTDPALDGPGRWARAVGPMQFLPSTWAMDGMDGNGDLTADPNNIDDAALSAGHYLCVAGGNLGTDNGWSTAVLAYNHGDSYLEQVRVQADAYATESSQ